MRSLLESSLSWAMAGPFTPRHLAFIWKILYKIQPNQFYTVLLYNRGTEPQTILFYHTDEVQVPQVPRM